MLTTSFNSLNRCKVHKNKPNKKDDHRIINRKLRHLISPGDNRTHRSERYHQEALSNHSKEICRQHPPPIGFQFISLAGPQDNIESVSHRFDIRGGGDGTPT